MVGDELSAQQRPQEGEADGTVAHDGWPPFNARRSV